MLTVGYQVLLAIVLAAGVDLCTGAPPPPGEPEKHQVIIVGAGVSGFTAAATLLEHNVTDLLVLEASDRIGGRTHTVQFGGVPLDKGAEFVHGEKNNSVYELVQPYDLLTSYSAMLESNMFIFANTSGFAYNSTRVRQILDDAYSIFYEDDVINFNGSMADYFYPRLEKLLNSNNVEPPLREAFRHLAPLLELSNTVGDDLSQLGAFGFADCLSNEGDINLKWKPGTQGYKTLFDIVSKKFPNPSEELPVMNKTVLNKQVTRVERRQGEGEVQVTCADGSTYLADHVIVTVSLGVLKKHAASMFHPALSSEKTTAIEALGFGCLGKVFVLFPTRWWPKDINAFIPLFSEQELKDFQANSSYASWSSYTTGFVPVMNHDRMLCAWFSGKACRTLDQLTDDQVIDGLMELLKKLVGDKFDVPRPEGILKSEWGSYPFTLGSYSYRSVESDRLNITNRVLAEPITEGNKPVVLFAGEATNHDYASLVNGALDTGRREARNILNYLNQQS